MTTKAELDTIAAKLAWNDQVILREWSVVDVQIHVEEEALTYWQAVAAGKALPALPEPTRESLQEWFDRNPQVEFTLDDGWAYYCASFKHTTQEVARLWTEAWSADCSTDAYHEGVERVMSRLEDVRIPYHPYVCACGNHHNNGAGLCFDCLEGAEAQPKEERTPRQRRARPGHAKAPPNDHVCQVDRDAWRLLKRLLGSGKRGTPKRGWHKLTPGRISRLPELSDDPAILLAAYNRLAASQWLRKSALQITCADLEWLEANPPVGYREAREGGEA